MDSSKSTPKAAKDAVSPSTITDYFRSSKLNHNRKRGKADVQKELVPSSVYLTPESSPGCHSNPENLVKEMSSHETIHAEPVQNSQLNPDALEVNDDSNSVPQSSSNVEPENISTSPTEAGNENADVRDIAENAAISGVASVTSTASQPSLHSPDKNLSPKKNSTSDTPTTTSSKNSNSPAFVAFQSLDTKTVSSPPSFPKLKLRKSARSNFQADAASAVKEGESPKPKSGRRKKKEPEPTKNSVITDYFQVRRSGRQTKSEIEREKQHQLEQMILTGCQDGLEVKEFESKGRGVVATKDFKKGDFVVEYAGELIDLDTARQREDKYAEDPDIGCYMYYFKCGANQHCVDATEESGKFGRLLNHSSKDGNCCTRSLEVKGVARLILVAKRDIKSGEELTYDYGDRSQAAIQAYPWLKL